MDLEEVVESCMVDKMKHHLEVNLKNLFVVMVVVVAVEMQGWQNNPNN